MSYTVLHLEKAKGNDSAMSAHIERTIHPKNADASRSHLNKELIVYPESIRDYRKSPGRNFGLRTKRSICINRYAI